MNNPEATRMMCMVGKVLILGPLTHTLLIVIGSIYFSILWSNSALILSQFYPLRLHVENHKNYQFDFHNLVNYHISQINSENDARKIKNHFTDLSLKKMQIIPKKYSFIVFNMNTKNFTIKRQHRQEVRPPLSLAS